MRIDVLKMLISEQFDVDPDEITEETNLYEDLSADSLDMVELAMACEEEFGVEIENTEENWENETVADILAFLEDRMEE